MTVSVGEEAIKEGRLRQSRLPIEDNLLAKRLASGNSGSSIRGLGEYSYSRGTVRQGWGEEVGVKRAKVELHA